LFRREKVLIKVKNLSKSYAKNPAVKNISFTVSEGHIYGFLGPNGAGKSTTMNIIAGCLAPTEGSVEINGCDIIDEPIGAKRSIGYLPEIPPLYTDMTPFEYLEFVGEAKGLRGEELYDEMEYVMEKTGILEVSDRLIKKLSKGYRQRVGIAQAIMGDPDIIILDEPTVGLDPLQIIEIRTLIKELSEGHTVILSSHILQEISAVCDRVIMISKGEIVANESLEKLTENETLEEAFVRLAGESIVSEDYPETEKEPSSEDRRGKKKIKIDSDLGPAYYSEIYVDEAPDPEDDNDAKGENE